TSHSDRLNDILAGWLQNGRDGIEATLSALFKAAAVAALARVVAEYAKKFGLTLEPGSAVLARVARWAKQEAKAFLDRCDGRIIEGILRLISSALRNGTPPAEIANLIRDYLKGWIELASDAAADEAILTREHGYYEANVSLGATTKQWFTVNDGRVCGVCRANEAQGAIPVGESFASGQQYPPAHISCRCRLHYEGVSRSSALHAS
ncbi:MAG: phage minor head protein, partial [FCB group bacterium]|nr:phage minor head protein [FCB group bacterium]